MEELEKENGISKRQIEEMHEKLNIQIFNPLKPQCGTENLVNDNDAKERKNQTFEREVEQVHSVSPFTKNLNKTKSIMSRLRYFSIINKVTNI